MSSFLPLLIAAGIIGLDQLTKMIILNTVQVTGSINVIDNLLVFTYVENRGAAFGFLKDQRWIFIVVTAIALIAFITYIIKGKRRDKLLILSLAFIVGGGVGNLIDRIARGYVIDFISVSFFPPVCNIADYFITAGTIMLLIYIVFRSDLFEKNLSKKAVSTAGVKPEGKDEMTKTDSREDNE